MTINAMPPIIAAMIPIITLIVGAIIVGSVASGVVQALLLDRSVTRPSPLGLAWRLVVGGVVLVLAVLTHTSTFAVPGWALGFVAGVVVVRRRRVHPDSTTPSP